MEKKDIFNNLENDVNQLSFYPKDIMKHSLDVDTNGYYDVFSNILPETETVKSKKEITVPFLGYNYNIIIPILGLAGLVGGFVTSKYLLKKKESKTHTTISMTGLAAGLLLGYFIKKPSKSVSTTNNNTTNNSGGKTMGTSNQLIIEGEKLVEQGGLTKDKIGAELMLTKLG